MRRVPLILGPVLAAVTWILVGALGLSSAAQSTAAVTALCAAWWITEAIPIPTTSLLPFALFPFLGVASPKELAGAYGHPLILLLLGGFLLSMAMERSGAHRRIALLLVRSIGGNGGARLVLGFMITSAALSMWISNSATTLMLLPVAAAVLEQDETDSLANPLLLGIAYAASIGGLGTPIGTPPNVVFMAIYRDHVGKELSFIDWMRIGVPAVLVLLPMAWWSLTRGLTAPQTLKLPQLGRWQPREKRVLCMFGLTALAWITRTAPFGGWQHWIPASSADDATVALVAALALFLLPDGNGQRLLDWETAVRIPWGLLLLFAGGLGIARAFDTSGLSAALGAGLAGLTSMPVLVMIGAICLCVTFLTEVTSNTATAALLMPVMASAALAAKLDPKVLMVPATLSASCAFMLPVATAPNAIVFGSGRISTQQMARTGFRLNLAAAGVLTGLCYWSLF